MEIAKWVAVVVAVLGVALLFTDLILNIKKRHNTKMNILALVFLSISLACFVLAQFVFKDQLPRSLTYLWIPFLAGYLVCDVIVAISIGKHNAKLKREKLNGETEPAEPTEE